MNRWEASRLPEWWQRLLARLPLATVAPCPSEGEPACSLAHAGDESVALARRLQPGERFLIAHPGMPAQPEHWRESLEEIFEATVHLLDPEPEADWLFAFGWKGLRVPQVRRRVRMITHRRALHMLGGGETQLLETLYALREQGVVADVSVALRLPEMPYDLNHLFSLFHADRLELLERCQEPFVISTIFWDYSELLQVSVALRAIFSQAEFFSPSLDHLSSCSHPEKKILEEPQAVQSLLDAWRPQPTAPLQPDPALRRVLRLGRLLLPNATREWEMVRRVFGATEPALIVPNGVRPERFLNAEPALFEQQYGLKDFVLCAARIDPNKNQLMLIWALRDTGLPLVLAGKESDAEYAALCRRWAGGQVRFVGELSPQMLASAYAAARVHALPSWSETPGLANLEAALTGCPLVVGNRGAEVEYLGEWAYVCDPGDARSIRSAVQQAWHEQNPARREARRQHVLQHYTWQRAARITAEAYERALQMPERWLLVPEWHNPATWLPALQHHVTCYAEPSPTLILYAGSLNGVAPTEAYEQVLHALEQLGVDAETCPDIELTDRLPAGDVRPLLTGSSCDLLLRVQYGARCIPLRDWLHRAA